MDLAPALARFLPELASIDTTEPLAPCASCVMAPVPEEAQLGGGRLRFTAAARCCTYHPRLANVLVGSALLDGGAGRERLRARLADADGVSALGIAPTTQAARRYAQRTAETFGRDPALTCPYWVEGPLGCSIHRHRNAICRSWSCRRTHGGRSSQVAAAVQRLLYDVEGRLAELAATALAAQVPPNHDVDRWVAYFEACAHWGDALPDDALHGPRRSALWAEIEAAIAHRDQPMPDRPTPSLRAWTLRADHMELQSWSPYDPVRAPVWVFELLGRLDGQTHWADAVAATEQAIGQAVPADLVARLWWRGCLAAPEADEGDHIQIFPG